MYEKEENASIVIDPVILLKAVHASSGKVIKAEIFSFFLYSVKFIGYFRRDIC